MSMFGLFTVEHSHRWRSMCRNTLLAICASMPVTAAAATPLKQLPADALDLHFERNVTDNDAELVLKVTSGLDLDRLEVVGPSGQVISSFSGTLLGPIGFTKFATETTEPTLREIQKQYPEGKYKVFLKAADGTRYAGRATLKDTMPNAPVISTPLPAAALSTDGFRIEWFPVAGAQRYKIVVEQEDEALVLSADAPAGASRFEVPNGWLLPGRKYVVGVSAVGDNRNVSVSEIFVHTNSDP